MNKRRKIFSLFLIFPVLALACSLASAPATQAPVIKQPTYAAPTLIPIQVPVELANEEAVLVNLYARANPAVVSIIVYAQQGQEMIPQGQGSGFVFDTEAHIVTNAHVVEGADQVEVIFWDGTTLEAEVLGEDFHADLAVLKVDSLPVGVQPLPLGDINNVAVGQTVVAIGNPFGLGGTMTRGIISALGRTIPALTTFNIPQAIQTDAPINPGNSGGPLLNLNGEVIGVNAQIETGGTSRTNSGVGFAIPVSIVHRVIPDLIATGKHEWAWLGVRGGSLTAALVKAMDLPVNKGAYIAEVIPNGPSAKAGLHGANSQETVNGQTVDTGGDVIIAIDGQTVGSFEDILVYIALSTSPGQDVVLTIIRNGKQMEVTVTMEARPAEVPQEQPQP